MGPRGILYKLVVSLTDERERRKEELNALSSKIARICAAIRVHLKSF